MKFFNSKAESMYRDYILANYEQIDVKPGACRWNFKCQFNAVHEAIERKDKKIAMTVYLDEGVPIIHFLNWDGKKYTDNTLGHWSSQNAYYFVKWIHQEEFFDVNIIFSKYRKHLRKQLPWWVRVLSNAIC